MLAALLAVLTLASAAWAECAWVMWWRYSYSNAVASPHFGGGTWEPAAAVPDFATCNAAAKQNAQRWARVGSEQKVEVIEMVGGGFQVHTSARKDVDL
jgi:hypothetical protein